MTTTRRLAFSLAALVAACGGASGTSGLRVVPTVDLAAASGAPHVERVRDLGPPVPLPEGALAATSGDGKFTVGEYVLVEGEDFGKLPTVLIGGRPARTLARTAGGGIVSQVPVGVSGGATAVEVSHPGGRHQVSIEVTRYAAVLAPEPAAGVHFLAVSGGEARAAGTAPLAGARGLRFSVFLDGAWAYVAAEAAISTIALTAPGGPAVVHTTKRKHPVVDVALAGKLLVVLGPATLDAYALDEPHTTAPYRTFALPPELAAAVPIAVDLSPDGQRLAILTAHDNTVAFISLAAPEAPVPLRSVRLLPAKRLPLARDLRFDATGTLWVVAGDSRASLAVGHQPTQLIRIDPDMGEARVVVIAGAGPPLAITPAPRESLRSATTIGDTAGDLPIFVTSIDQKLVAPAEGAAPATVVGSLAEPGQVVRTDSAGRGGPLPALPRSIAGAIALTPDAGLLLATAWTFAAEGGTARFGVWLAGVGEGGAAPRFVELGAPTTPPAYLPAALGDVAVQP